MESASPLVSSNAPLPIYLLTDLTERDWSILFELGNDLSVAEMAERLSLTPKSVENYKTRLGSKVGLKGYRKLASFARKHQTELRQWYQLLRGKIPPPSL